MVIIIIIIIININKYTEISVLQVYCCYSK